MLRSCLFYNLSGPSTPVSTLSNTHSPKHSHSKKRPPQRAWFEYFESIHGERATGPLKTLTVQLAQRWPSAAGHAAHAAAVSTPPLKGRTAALRQSAALKAYGQRASTRRAATKIGPSTRRSSRILLLFSRELSLVARWSRRRAEKVIAASNTEIHSGCEHI